MNILSVSSILPVPGYSQNNDFVFEFYNHYLEECKNDRIFFIFPIKYTNKIVKKISKDGNTALEIRKLKKYKYKNYEINTLAYLSSQRLRNLHAILSYTLYIFNKKLVDKLITENNINLVHAQLIFPDGMLAYNIWKKYKIPYIITSHNELKYFRHIISKKLSMKIFKSAYLVTPINFINYKFFLKNNLTNVIHLPLGSDNNFLKIKKKERDDNKTRIITIAKLIKVKNIDKVIIALDKLNEKYNFQYTIVGEGPEKDNLMALVKQYNLENKIKFSGQIAYDKIGDILSENDIFILVSYFETFGRVYFEAMAVKLPVICAKNSGIYGLFREMEEGISVDHTDIDDIANKLELLISNKTLRDRIGKNGHKLARNYTWEKLAIKYNNIYKKALNTKNEKNPSHI